MSEKPGPRIPAMIVPSNLHNIQQEALCLARAAMPPGHRFILVLTTKILLFPPLPFQEGTGFLDTAPCTPSAQHALALCGVESNSTLLPLLGSDPLLSVGLVCILPIWSESGSLHNDLLV